MDQLVHYHMFDYSARGVVIVTTDTVREAQKRHQLDPVTTIALGRALTSIAMLASTLKSGKSYIHGVFSGEGPLKKVVAECNGDGECRGYTAPSQMASVISKSSAMPDSIGAAMGHSGTLTITHGSPGLTNSYQAISKLENGEIAADVARYLSDSEQIPSAVAAGVKLSATGEVLSAGGVLVQRLGGAELGDSELSLIESRLATGLHISDRIAGGETPDQIMRFLQGTDGNFGQLLVRDIRFHCGCSQEKMMGALSAISESELRKIEEETGGIEVRCHYCNTARSFRLEQLLRH